MSKNLQEIPRYKNCFVCGSANVSGLKTHFITDQKQVFCDVIFQPEHVGYRNRIHGGVISGVLDEAMGWVCYVHSNNFYYTVELTVSYLKPVSPRESFQVLASLDKLKRGFGFTVAVLLDIHGDVVAKASGKFCEVHPDDYEDIYSILDTD